MTVPVERPAVAITYCAQCNFLLRAAWLAQELLSTFGQDLARVSLVPGSGGAFLVTAGEHVLWDRAGEGRFPEAKELKQRLRDVAFPGRDLGHSDGR